MSWGHRSEWMVTGKCEEEIVVADLEKVGRRRMRCEGRLISPVRKMEECLEEKRGRRGASFDKLEFLMVHLHSQVVLPVQLILFVCLWLLLWRQLHAPCFSQNKHKLRCGNSGGKKSLQSATLMEVFLTIFYLLVYEKKAKYPLYMSCDVLPIWKYRFI